MSRELVDGAAAFGRIRSFIFKKYGTQRKCARALGISESHLSDMLNARCELSPSLLAAAGLVRRVVYEVRELPEREADTCRKGEAIMPPSSRSVHKRSEDNSTVGMGNLHDLNICLVAEATALGVNRSLSMALPSMSQRDGNR